MRGDGPVPCWGYVSNGQLGNGTIAAWQPAPVVDLVAPTAVASGAYHSCAIAAPNSSVYCWGADDDAQLGDHSGAPQTRPVFANITGALQLALGDEHSCALLTDRTVWCWGDGSDGQLGNGQTDEASPPVQVTGLTAVTAIAAGDGFTCAVNATGAFCWGSDDAGQLGDSVGGAGGASQSLPKKVAGVTGATMIAAGTSHACAGSSTGIQCWGDGECGQLGGGSETGLSGPVSVVGAGTMWMPSKLATGADHTCAVDLAGRLRCWGRNDNGELGDGTSVDRASPVTVNALTTTVRDVAAGGDNTCADTSAGPRCWGENYYGEVGDGTTATRYAPATVKALAATRPAPGTFHACAVAGGQVQCWGDNSVGQLGNGTISISLEPTEVDFSQLPWRAGSPHGAGPGRPHRRARDTVKCIGERRQVAQRPVDPELGGRVRIDGQPALGLGGPLARTPDLRDAQEELLIFGIAIGDIGLGRVLAQCAKRAKCHFHTAHVCDVLSQRQLALDVLLGQRLERRVLIGDAAAAVGEPGEVVLLPPVLEVAVGVELRALVIEAVGELVADHHADRAEVGREPAVGTEERRLQDDRR
jgi:alpha-tubulin suppressor-like RCC1 family protein